MMNDGISVNGKIYLKHTRNGEVINEITDKNTVLTIGKSQIAGHMVGDLTIGSRVDWMSLGIGSSTIAAGDTSIGSEYIKYGLGSITGSTTTTTTANDTAFWIGSFGITESKTINEAGLFNDSGLNTGSMYARTCFSDIVAVSGDTVIANWKIAFA
jgi:hypothetical protein